MSTLTNIHVLNSLQQAIKQGHKHLICALCEELDERTLTNTEQEKYTELLKSL